MIDARHHRSFRDALAAVAASDDRVLYLPGGQPYDASHVSIPAGIELWCSPGCLWDVTKGPVYLRGAQGLIIRGMPRLIGDGGGPGVVIEDLHGAYLELHFQEVHVGLTVRGESFYNRMLLWADKIDCGVEVEGGPCNDNHLLAGSRIWCSQSGLRFREPAHLWTGTGVAFEGPAQHLNLKGENHDFRACRFEITKAAGAYAQAPVVLQVDTAHCTVTGRGDHAFSSINRGSPTNEVDVT